MTASEPHRERASAWLRRLGGIALGLAVLLVVTELAIARWIQTPSTSLDDARFGQIQRPNVRVVNSLEGYCVTRTNSWGRFDDEPRSPRARTVALLVGDSYAEALQVEPAGSFARLVEARLEGVEIFNAAQSGGHPARYPDVVAGYAPVLRPDLVILQVNDGDVPELADPRLLAEARTLAARGAGVAAEPPSGSRAAARGGLKAFVLRSALVKYASIRLTLLAGRERERLARKFGIGAAHDAMVAAAPAPDPALDPEVAARMDGVLVAMREAGPDPILLYIPAMAYFGGPARPAHPERRAFWHAAAARRGLEIVDPGDAFAADYGAHRQPLHGFANSVPGTGHINARGHRVVAELLARAIERRLDDRSAPRALAGATSATGADAP